VLFCGGLGLRMRDYSDTIPKPMVPIGDRPILWHVMRYYAHFGHNEFTLCLGYRADVIKDFFLRYAETAGSDFALSDGGRSVERLRSDIEDWRIDFIDTGLDAPVGQRLLAVRDQIGEDEVFLANYGDVLTDAPLDQLLARFLQSGKMAAFIAVRPSAYTFHVVSTNDRDQVTSLESISSADLRINGGYFMFRRAIFDEIGPDEDLVPDVFSRLIERGEVLGFRYDGFWAPMDTLRDWQILEGRVADGDIPWAVWEPSVESGSTKPLPPRIVTS